MQGADIADPKGLAIIVDADIDDANILIVEESDCSLLRPVTEFTPVFDAIGFRYTYVFLVRIVIIPGGTVSICLDGRFDGYPTGLRRR